MISVPWAVVLFALGLMGTLIGYIWNSLANRISKLERRVDCIGSMDGNWATLEQTKEIITAQFNEFRLELYRSGVLKAQTRKKTE
jgi:hypothetical protein